MQDLLLLQEKLDQLLKAFSDLEEAHKRLQKKNQKQENQIESLKKEIASLQEKQKINSIAQATEELEGERKDRLKAELDKIIIILNKNIELLK